MFCIITLSFFCYPLSQVVGNKAKGQISKRVFRENKARQIFRKIEHFLPPETHTYVCVSAGKKCSFFGKLGVLCFLETPVFRCAFLPYYQRSRGILTPVAFILQVMDTLVLDTLFKTSLDNIFVTDTSKF